MSEASQVNIGQEETNSLIERVKAVANTAIQSIKATKEEFDSAKVETQSARRSLNVVKKNFDDKVTEVEQLNHTYQKIEGTLNSIKENVKKSSVQIEVDVKVVNDNKNALVKIKNDSDKELTEIKLLNSEIEKNVINAKERHDNIIELSDRLLKDIKNEDGTIANPSVSTSINDIQNKSEVKLNELKAEQEKTKKDFENLKLELRKKILDLLPEGTAASLAHGFYKSKKKHDIFFVTAVYYILFIAPLAVVTGYFIQNVSPETVTVSGFLARILIISPLLGISSFGVYSIYRNRKLYDHYNRQQRITEMYEGFDRAIDEDGLTEERKSLTDILLNAVSEKVSDTDKYEKNPNVINNVLENIGQKINKGNVIKQVTE